MLTTLSPPGQSLQTIFEHALSQLCLGTPNLTEALKDVFNYLEALHNNILKAKLMTNNVILYNMYCMGEALTFNKEKPNKHIKFQITSDFLFRYFQDEPDAIPYLQGISCNTIMSLSGRERQIIINNRPSIDDLVDVEEDPTWLTLWNKMISTPKPITPAEVLDLTQDDEHQPPVIPDIDTLELLFNSTIATLPISSSHRADQDDTTHALKHSAHRPTRDPRRKRLHPYHLD
jgi:hypothetical protein